MVNYAIMFKVKEGGVIEPIDWNKENLKPNNSIIIIDETTLTIVLWHGKNQGIVNRRIALRQAESLKGHGYNTGKTIVGRGIKRLIEIDQRKLNRDPEADELNADLEEILNRDFEFHEGKFVTFGEGEVKVVIQEKKKKKLIKKEITDNKKVSKKEVSQPEREISQQRVTRKGPEDKALLIKVQEYIEDIGDIRTLMKRIEDLETTVELLAKKMRNSEVQQQDRDASTPKIIKDIQAMKDAVKKNEKIPDDIQYPSRENFIKEKMQKLDANKKE
ncbi:MAG: hypothetical protein ACTSR8_04315 [Promethearchaeota archaeon]